MNVISASSAVVHAVQYQTVTQSTYERQPEIPIRPILDDQETVAFGSRYSYSAPIGSTNTSGHHINQTV